MEASTKKIKWLLVLRNTLDFAKCKFGNLQRFLYWYFLHMKTSDHLPPMLTCPTLSHTNTVFCSAFSFLGSGQHTNVWNVEYSLYWQGMKTNLFLSKCCYYGPQCNSNSWVGFEIKRGTFYRCYMLLSAALEQTWRDSLVLLILAMSNTARA